MKLSLCMIVKNEERFLPAFIEAHREFFDDWVIVDTGSTDRTREIIREAGLPEYQFEWCNDFSKARNYALSLCSGEWVAAFDADEILDSAGQLQVKHAMQEHQVDAFSIKIKNYVRENDDFASQRDHLIDYNPPDESYSSVFADGEDHGYVETQLIRFFRRAAGWHWTSPVHEVLTSPEEASVAFLSGVFLHHLGSMNLEGKRESKNAMYRDISLEMHGDLEECHDPKQLFESARFVDDLSEKLRLLERAHALAPLDLYILRELANSFLQQQDLQSALSCCEKMVDVEPENLEGYLARAHCYWMMKKPDQAISGLKAIYPQFRNKAMLHYTLATLLLQTKDYSAARSHAQRAARLAPKSRTLTALHERMASLGSGAE